MYQNQAQFGSQYIPVESLPTIKAGEYLVRIETAEMQVARSGNPMAVLQFEIKDSQLKLKYWLVQNYQDEKSIEFTNHRFTVFFDTFKIQRGNFNIQNWIGKTGFAYIDEGKAQDDGKKYMEIKYFIANHPAQQLPNYNQVKNYNQVQQPQENKFNQQYKEDIPF